MHWESKIFTETVRSRNLSCFFSVPDNVSGKIINRYKFKAGEMKSYKMIGFFF